MLHNDQMEVDVPKHEQHSTNTPWKSKLVMDDADSNDFDTDWEGSSQASEGSDLGQGNHLSKSTIQNVS